VGSRVSIWPTIILGLYDPPRNPRKRERATNQQSVDPPAFPHCLEIRLKPLRIPQHQIGDQIAHEHRQVALDETHRMSKSTESYPWMRRFLSPPFHELDGLPCVFEHVKQADAATLVTAVRPVFLRKSLSTRRMRPRSWTRVN